jgi:hypothetical protein
VTTDRVFGRGKYGFSRFTLDYRLCGTAVDGLRKTVS